LKQAVLAALDCGYRHIDCAAAYGNEREVGEALSELLGPGKVAYLQTKSSISSPSSRSTNEICTIYDYHIVPETRRHFCDLQVVEHQTPSR